MGRVGLCYLRVVRGEVSDYAKLHVERDQVELPCGLKLGVLIRQSLVITWAQMERPPGGGLFCFVGNGARSIQQFMLES